MRYHAKFDILPMADTGMEYIRFGNGPKNLVMLPGLGDSLRSMKGTALPLAIMYRAFAKEYTVYIFSRKTSLSQGCSTRDMARDQAKAMELLGIDRADLFGVSMGGMIAQHLAADFPEKVNRLVLAVTAPACNPIMTDSIGEWVTLAKADNHTKFMESNLRRIYSPEYCQRNRWLIPVIGKLTKPRSYDRFFLQANACLTHNASQQLGKITAPTLVIGGEKDLTLGAEPSKQLAASIPQATLKLYPQWGHGLYEEEKDFIPTVFAFLKASQSL